MKLDSARNAKFSIFDKLIKGAILPATRLIAHSASPANAIAEPRSRATLALGITRKGKSDYVVAVRIQKRALEGEVVVDAIRRQVRGEIDVRYIGRVYPKAADWRFRRQRPLLIGASVGHHRITAGTIGCFVKPSKGVGGLMILSNNHVLADENQAKRGDAIVQPGPLDGGRAPKDTVAALTRHIPLKWSGANYVDAAVAAVKDGISADPTQLRDLGVLAGPSPVELDIGDEVRKVGRTTGVTRGRVSSIEIDNVFVEYDNGLARFDNQIEIEPIGSRPFSRGGDSGSLILTADLRPAALLFAGSDHGGPGDRGVTYANPIKRVLKDLKVRIVVQ